MAYRDITAVPGVSVAVVDTAQLTSAPTTLSPDVIEPEVTEEKQRLPKAGELVFFVGQPEEKYLAYLGAAYPTTEIRIAPTFEQLGEALRAFSSVRRLVIGCHGKVVDSNGSRRASVWGNGYDAIDSEIVSVAEKWAAGGMPRIEEGVVFEACSLAKAPKSMFSFARRINTPCVSVWHHSLCWRAFPVGGWMNGKAEFEVENTEHIIKRTTYDSLMLAGERYLVGLASASSAPIVVRESLVFAGFVSPGQTEPPFFDELQAAILNNASGKTFSGIIKKYREPQNSIRAFLPAGEPKSIGEQIFGGMSMGDYDAQFLDVPRQIHFLLVR